MSVWVGVGAAGDVTARGQRELERQWSPAVGARILSQLRCSVALCAAPGVCVSSRQLLKLAVSQSLSVSVSLSPSLPIASVCASGEL